MLASMTPQEFVAKWQKSELKERSAAQEHFIDLCRLFGHPTPAEADPTGTSFAFEAGATKARGGQGYADVWKKGHFAWEYKGKHKDLARAYQQLLQYRESLINPPLLVVSDFDRIIIHTNFTNTVKREILISLDDLLEPAKREQLRAVFYNPQALRSAQTTEQVTEAAASLFAQLADHLRQSGADPEQAAHFLIRLLFCLFAEDVGLLPEDLFTRLVQQTQANPAAFAGQLRQLFGAMALGGWFGVEQIPHFDGRLFDDDRVLDLNRKALDVLAQVATLDWADIEPSIFGTLFERSLDPAKRSQLGAHYTSRADILLIVEPVLMVPLRRRWDEVQAQAEELVQRRDEADTRRKRENRQRDLGQLFMDFAKEIAEVQVLDPACGSGNFLYVALRQLLDLEKEVVNFAADLGVGRFFPSVSPAQLHGIEINPYAHQLAQTTIWIGYIQWLRENGFGSPSQPILKPLDTILLMDAILAYDEEGRPVEPEWPAADVIIGNPPFLGDKKMRAELGDRYVDALRRVFGDRIPGQSDLVCYWFEKAHALVKGVNVRRVGLLATQAIRGGANRTVLDRISEAGGIFWAYSDRDWILDGATVHVSLIGFDDGTETDRQLDGNPVTRINPDLSSTVDLTAAVTLKENRSLSFIGTQKTGPFDLTYDQAQMMMGDKGNPHGRPNREVLRPWINATDITRRPRNKWIIDFGVDMSLEEAAQYAMPMEHVREHVKPRRDKVRRKGHRERWWRFGETRPGMRKALSTLSRYIATPLVSKHRVFAWVSCDVVPENLLVVIARDDDYFLGVLHTTPHELWARKKGTQLREAESGSRYTPSTTFETFPFPWLPGREPQDDPRVQAIAQAAKELVEKRDAWLNPEGATEKELKKRTLTNLYNQRPMWLDLAHQKLDHAVLDAYGWSHDLTDEEVLERLLELNLERAAEQQG